MSNDLKLLPCPFCGAEGENDHTGVWWVRCVDCSAEGPSRPTEAEAAAAWNERQESPALRDILAAHAKRAGWALNLSATMNGDRRRKLVMAAVLLLAEIDRMDRAGKVS